jgi:tetratricopeptide (TPR) repeat protein
MGLDGDRKQALALVDQAAAALRDLDEAAAAQSWTLRLHAIALTTRATLHTLDGHADRARKDIEDAVAWMEKLPPADRNDSGAQHQLALLYRKLGDADHVLEAERALAHYRKAIEIWRPLAKAHPASWEYGFNLALTHQFTGSIEQRLGRLDDAFASFAAGQSVAERFVAGNPDVRPLLNSLAHAQFNMGNLWYRKKKLDEAIRSLQASFNLFEKLVEADPRDAVHLASWGASISSLAIAQHSAGKTREAIANCRRMVATLEPALARNDFAMGRAIAATAYALLGQFHAALKEPEEAVPVLEKAIAHAEWARKNPLVGLVIPSDLVPMLQTQLSEQRLLTKAK